MTLLLGVDTGGTYADAVLIRNEAQVITSAKSLTTREDLALGIGAVVRDVLAQAAVSPKNISLASLSTTLATNALVEAQDIFIEATISVEASGRPRISHSVK